MGLEPPTGDARGCGVLRWNRAMGDSGGADRGGSRRTLRGRAGRLRPSGREAGPRGAREAQDLGPPGGAVGHGRSRGLGRA